MIIYTKFNKRYFTVSMSFLVITIICFAAEDHVGEEKTEGVHPF